jgi:hypothetical protein
VSPVDDQRREHRRRTQSPRHLRSTQGMRAIRMPCQQRDLERDTTSYGPRSCFLPARVHVVMRIGGDVRAAFSVVAARAVPGLVAEHGGGCAFEAAVTAVADVC